MKKKILTILSLVLCAILLVAGTVAGTIAWLTSQDEVNNTFTVGDVEITMTEISKTGNARVEANEYKLIPGKTYTNDLKIHVADNSEDCYIFAKLPANANITYNLANGWTLLDGTENIYVYQTSAHAGDDITVVSSFTVSGTATHNDLLAVTTPIHFVGYAVQVEGFTSAAQAWQNAGFN